jgi:hypothetical protein
MRKILIVAATLVALLPATAQAHRYGASYGCIKGGWPSCDGTLSNGEAIMFEGFEYDLHHVKQGRYIWAHHRINSSATWVAHRTAYKGSSDNCLVDVDFGSIWLYKITCYEWDEGPRP